MSSYDQAVIDALNPFREGLRADGADLAVERVKDDRLVVALLTTKETCRDCILPTEILEEMFRSVILRETGIDFKVTVHEAEYPMTT